MSICASCKARVEDGAVRCLGCGAVLSNPASFMQVSGWVLAAVSTVPVGLGIVTEAERDHVPLIVGLCALAVGVLLIVVGRSRTKDAEPTTRPDEEGEEES